MQMNKFFKVVTKTIWNCLNIETLYESTEFESHQHDEPTDILTHKEKFVHRIVTEYMNLKSTNIGRRITDEQWAESMKRRLAKRMAILDGR